MAIQAVPGTWNLFGLNLPDLGLTEMFGGGTTQPTNTTWNNSNVYEVLDAQKQPTPTVINGVVQSPNRDAFNKTLQTPISSSGTGSTVITNPNPQQPTQQQQPQQPAVDPYAGLRSDISSGWDNYINSLNDQMSGLDTQRSAQENIAGSMYDSQVSGANLQKQQGLQQLDFARQSAQKNQVKTLRDLSSNIKNSFMAGNVFLGSRGAGDSSASDQYALALTKMGNQQRGDVMNQTSDILNQVNMKETDLNNIYNNNINQLDAQRSQRMSEISSWFASAQNQIRQAQSQGMLGKNQDLNSLSKDILNQAISQANAINQEMANKRSMLDQWALGVSKNIGELKTNMSEVSKYAPTLPGYSPVVGQPQVGSQGNIYVPRGYASTDKAQFDQYGNRIS